MTLVAECPLCHVVRRERENYARFERQLMDDARPCTTCGRDTYWLVGERRAVPERVAS